ncbi:MAG: hypothetical protein ACJ78W_09105 [Myxococcales bacterium]
MHRYAGLQVPLLPDTTSKSDAVFAVADLRSEVPPTAVTNCEAAGNSTPKPLSPELTVMAMPGWS